MSKRARSINAAISRYKESFQRALTCLSSTDIWYAANPGHGQEHHRLTLANGPLLLATEGPGVFFDASQLFSVYHDGDEFRVHTEGYIYTLSETEILEQEIVSWHWHPPSRTRPHVHIGSAQLGHIPTGRVTFEAVVRYIIVELGATPGRKDWEDHLMATEARHTQYRSWHVAPNVDPTDDP